MINHSIQKDAEPQNRLYDRRKAVTYQHTKVLLYMRDAS